MDNEWGLRSFTIDYSETRRQKEKININLYGKNKKRGRMMRASLMAVTLIGVTCLLFGCAAPTRITSEPNSASISLNGTPIGTTPFAYEVKDIVGMNSSYGFTAEKAGYHPETKIFREKGFDDAKATIPPQIHFVLRPIPEERPTTRYELKQQTDENALPLNQLPQSVEPF
jgi:hypothetical protein